MMRSRRSSARCCRASSIPRTTGGWSTARTAMRRLSGGISARSRAQRSATIRQPSRHGSKPSCARRSWLNSAAEAAQRFAHATPSNLAGARNVGSRSGPAWSGPASLNDIFDRRKPVSLRRRPRDKRGPIAPSYRDEASSRDRLAHVAISSDAVTLWVAGLRGDDGENDPHLPIRRCLHHLKRTQHTWLTRLLARVSLWSSGTTSSSPNTSPKTATPARWGRTRTRSSRSRRTSPRSPATGSTSRSSTS